MFAGLLNTDFSRKFGKVGVVFEFEVWAAVTFRLREVENVRLEFQPENSWNSMRLAHLEKKFFTYFSWYLAMQIVLIL